MRVRGLAVYFCSTIAAVAFQASHYATPAGNRPALRGAGTASILPGGRIVAPRGLQLPTGPGPFGLALSPGGKIITANLGPERLSVTVMQPDKKGPWLVRNFVTSPLDSSFGPFEFEGSDWHGVFTGIAFSSEKAAWVTEGNSGRVRLLDVTNGERRRVTDLNQNGFWGSFTGDLAYDQGRGVVYIADQANFRIVAIDSKRGQILSSVRVGRLPFALCLSEDGKFVYVTNLGVFEYQAIPGADPKNARETGLPFPAFGFPSAGAVQGVQRRRLSGTVQVPGLGDPNREEANSIAIVNVADPAAPKVEGFVKTGRPFASDTPGGSGPSGVIAIARQIFVSNAHDDSISIVDPQARSIIGEIQLRIPRFELLRGLLPLGMAYVPDKDWLLVAEAGINALGVIDVKNRQVIGHIPTGWFPTRVAFQQGIVYVTNAKGQGTGPNAIAREMFFESGGLAGVLRRGSVSVFPLPSLDDLKKDTAIVLTANGFLPLSGAPSPLPQEIRHVVLIVKENRTFDEVFGDIRSASNGPVAGARNLARFGATGYVSGGKQRFSLHGVGVTPNHHAIAARWAFGDNFYADSEVSVDGHHWLVGNYPDAWTESSLMASYGSQRNFQLPTTAPGRLSFAESDASVYPEEIQEAGTLWHHLQEHGISFRNFGEGFELPGVNEGEGLKPFGTRYLTNMPVPEPLFENTSREYPGFNMNIPDQYRATQFIHELEENYAKPGKPLPRFIYIHLPNDHMTTARPADGYPYPASFVADNDYALGRIVEYLSHSPWWRQMAIFVTEDDAQGGRDHIDSHRTVLLGIGPWFRKNYVIHQNTSFPGLLKTIFRLLDLPPLNLFDATAADISEAFTAEPEFQPYDVVPEDPRLFDPTRAREPLDPKPSVKMDSFQ